MSDNRPTCVVIDEIDGATGGGDSGFVRTLVKFVMDGSKVPRKGGQYWSCSARFSLSINCVDSIQGERQEREQTIDTTYHLHL